MQGRVPWDFLFVKMPFPLLFPNIYWAFPLSHTERKHFPHWRSKHFPDFPQRQQIGTDTSRTPQIWWLSKLMTETSSRQGWEGCRGSSHTPLCLGQNSVVGTAAALTSSLSVKGPPASSPHGSLHLHVLECSSSSPCSTSFVVMECLVNFCLRSAWPFALVPHQIEDLGFGPLIDRYWLFWFELLHVA